MVSCAEANIAKMSSPCDVASRSGSMNYCNILGVLNYLYLVTSRDGLMFVTLSTTRTILLGDVGVISPGEPGVSL